MMFFEQQDELAQHPPEMSEMRDQQEEKVTARLLKPTLQNLGPDDDVEHFLSTFMRIAWQQGWPDGLGHPVDSLLTGKALPAYAELNRASATSDGKESHFYRYDVSEETPPSSLPD